MSATLHPYPLHTAAGIRAVETAARRHDPDVELMERAGAAAAEAIRRALPARGGRVLLLAGPGNNGGDALVAARHLIGDMHRAVVVLLGNPSNLPYDASRALTRLREAGVTPEPAMPDPTGFDLVVDGLFGIGLKRPLEGDWLQAVKRVNASGVPVLALDVPSGLDADTGTVPGTAIQARRTLSFIALKPGLLTMDGPDHCGVVELAPLGIDAEALVPATGHALDAACLARLLPPRRLNSHKGTFGSVGILGGASGMVGAALLAARAALLCGAGRVYVGTVDDAGDALTPAQSELMWRSPDALLRSEALTALVAGPGLGRSDEAADFVWRAIRSDVPLLLDADALNVTAEEPRLVALLAKRTAPTLLTPHPAEAARLLGRSVTEMQQDRVASACELSARMHSHVVLKGVGSVCASPDGAWSINRSGNPGMGSAGMGDVLAGMVGALLAQGMAAADALAMGVHLHGTAADELVGRGIGPVGLTASEVSLQARETLNRWVYGDAKGRIGHPG